MKRDGGKMRIEGVIFDMDGLMIDTEKLLKRFWCQAARELGYPMKTEHVLSIRSLAAKYAIPKLKALLGEDFDYYAVRSRRMELMKSHIELHGLEKKRGLDILLCYLKEKKLRLALATATDENRTEQYLKSIGVYEYFDEIVCGNMIENGKPAPDIYLKAAELLQLPTEKCIALEDSPNGILSAYRAGCIPIMVPDLDQPDTEIQEILYAKAKDLQQVISILEQIDNLGQA